MHSGAGIDRRRAILFVNGAWLGVDDGRSASETLNETIVARLGALFAAGEATAPDAVGQSVVDASEIINTLSDAGFTTLGYASQDLQTGAGSGDGTVIDQLRTAFSVTTQTMSTKSRRTTPSRRHFAERCVAN